MRESIVIGDLHGTIDEFNHLLKKLKYNKTEHRLILVGDILDRGRDPVGLLHQIQDIGIETVLGNHEEKVLRWRKYEALRELTDQENPMKKLVPERQAEWEALTKHDIQWLANLPLKIHVKDNWYVVHAGMEPAVAFDEQDIGRIIRIRYVDKKTLRYVKPKTKEQPPGTDYWADRWDQPYNIIFGHQKFDKPMVFKNKNNVCIGIDTGCVFGGSLTAFNVDKNEFIQVKADKAYYKK
jgi:bis(5'-nucleosyl)-tetraphosphatase (symmetrical)